MHPLALPLRVVFLLSVIAIGSQEVLLGSPTPTLGCAAAWTATDTTKAPTARFDHTAVWTGHEMIVWGGSDGPNLLNTGGRYNPATDGWTATSVRDAPTARANHTAVWTGHEMIVWGGIDDGGPPLSVSGGRYNPALDSWTPISTTKRLLVDSVSRQFGQAAK